MKILYDLPAPQALKHRLNPENLEKRLKTYNLAAKILAHHLKTSAYRAKVPAEQVKLAARAG